MGAAEGKGGGGGRRVSELVRPRGKIPRSLLREGPLRSWPAPLFSSATPSLAHAQITVDISPTHRVLGVCGTQQLRLDLDQHHQLLLRGQGQGLRARWVGEGVCRKHGPRGLGPRDAWIQALRGAAKVPDPDRTSLSSSPSVSVRKLSSNASIATTLRRQASCHDLHTRVNACHMRFMAGYWRCKAPVRSGAFRRSGRFTGLAGPGAYMPKGAWEGRTPVGFSNPCLQHLTCTPSSNSMPPAFPVIHVPASMRAGRSPATPLPTLPTV